MGRRHHISGNVVALAMDLTEKGVEDFGLRFGETDSYVKAPALTAKREGVGAELALGARALAAKYGHPELGFEVKSLELPGFDPRGSFGMSLAYATADRGGCHMRAFPAGDELETGTRPPDSLEGKAQYTIDLQNEGAAKWSAGLCDFWQVDVEQLRLLCERIWGRSVSEDEFLQLGERVWNLGRLFNLREGVEPDDLPSLMRAEEGAFADGLSAGKFIGEQAFAAALQEYYALRGWDENGVPSRPSSPSSASTFASRRPLARGKGHTMPHVMISKKKCTGCHMCELACSALARGRLPSLASRGSSRRSTRRRGAIKGHTCLQTGCAKCQEACPDGRHRDEGDHRHASRATSPAARSSATP